MILCACAPTATETRRDMDERHKRQEHTFMVHMLLLSVYVCCADHSCFCSLQGAAGASHRKIKCTNPAAEDNSPYYAVIRGVGGGSLGCYYRKQCEILLYSGKENEGLEICKNMQGFAGGSENPIASAT